MKSLVTGLPPDLRFRAKGQLVMKTGELAFCYCYVPARAATPRTTCENLRSARRGRPDARLYVRSRGPACPQLSGDHASVERTMILKAAGTPVQRHARS